MRPRSREAEKRDVLSKVGSLDRLCSIYTHSFLRLRPLSFLLLPLAIAKGKPARSISLGTTAISDLPSNWCLSFRHSVFPCPVLLGFAARPPVPRVGVPTPPLSPGCERF